jgi:hypothetical protein
VPKSGWESFNSEFNECTYYQFEDMMKIEGFEINHTDGYRYEIEIASKNKYRSLSFSAPTLYREDYPEYNEVVKLLQLIKSEFDIINNELQTDYWIKENTN